MKQCKILFLTHKFYPDIGGIEVNSEVLAKGFHSHGHDVRLLTWTEEKGEKEFPFQVIRKPSKRELFKQHRWADVVYENNPCLRMSWPRLFFSSASVIALRTQVSRLNGSKAIQDHIKFKALKHAGVVIAVSNAIRREFWPEAHVIPNPYRDDVFKLKSAINRDKDFVFFGRLVDEKGVQTALRALQELKTEYGKNFDRFTVIGDGPYEAELKRLTAELGLNDQVYFAGRLIGADLADKLNEHKYLLLPSTNEAFGNVALEGIACGCLPFVSDNAGLPDAVGTAGITFEVNDFKALAREINDVLIDPDKEESIRANAKVHLKAHLAQNIINRYMAAIEHACFEENGTDKSF